MKNRLYLIAIGMIFFVPSVSHAQYACSMSASPSTVAPGQSTTITYDCNVSWDLSYMPYARVLPSNDWPVCNVGSFTVTPSETTTYTMTGPYPASCIGYEYCAVAYGATFSCNVTVAVDPCPTPIESYWGAGNYLFWSAATRRINAAGVNVCATNNAGSHYFVPGRTYAEIQSFVNAAWRLGVSIF